MSRYYMASRRTADRIGAAVSRATKQAVGTICTVAVGDVDLHGLMLDNRRITTSENRAIACLFLHGTGSNFYENKWVFPLAGMMNRNGIAFLSANNRGSHGYCPYPPHGAALERFDGCVDDINGWISHLKEQGYTEFILLGHSLGAEKVVHYMNQGKQEGYVIGIILLGFSDSYDEQMDHWGSRFDDLMREAESLVDGGKPETFLTEEWLSHAGVLPKSGASFVDFFSEGSDLSKALPFPSGSLEKYSKIRVPILGVIGDRDFDEWTAVTVDQAVDLMRSENPNSTVESILDCDHDFTGRHDELCSIVDSFIRSKLIE